MAILQRLYNAHLSRDFQNHIISLFVTSNGELQAVSARTITNALKKSVRLLKLEEVGVHASLVSIHSLRSGGATVMHLNGIPDTIIEKMGRWSSDTFLIYMQEQLSIFSKNVLW